MTTLQQIELTCPVCETRFRSQAVVSTNSFGGKRTDFHERAAGTQPLPYLVHMCSRCGYAGSEKDFTEEAEITPTLREHVWNELAPKLHQSVLWHQQHGNQGNGGSNGNASSSSSLLGQGSSGNTSAGSHQQTGTTGAVAAMVAVPGSEKDFTQEAEITPTLREHVWNELAPKLHQSVLWHQQHGSQGSGSSGTTGSAGSAMLGQNANSSTSNSSSSSSTGSAGSQQTGTTGAVAAMVAVPGSEKYEAAARVAEWAGAEPRQVADLLLRAAWCCVDEGDVEAERYFRRRAAWAFEQALSAYDGVAREERAVLTYLVGELWRRVGDPKQARAWFEQVAHEITDAHSQQWVLDASRQQKDAPREWFG